MWERDEISYSGRRAKDATDRRLTRRRCAVGYVLLPTSYALTSFHDINNVFPLNQPHTLPYELIHCSI